MKILKIIKMVHKDLQVNDKLDFCIESYLLILISC